MKNNLFFRLAAVTLCSRDLQGFAPRPQVATTTHVLLSTPDPTAVPQPDPDPTAVPGIERNPDPSTYPPRPTLPSSNPDFPKPKTVPQPDHWPDAPKKGNPVM